MSVLGHLARNVRDRRQQQGWSQEGLAEHAGLHRTYVSGIEREKRNPTVTVVERLAGALETRPCCLLCPCAPRDEPRSCACAASNEAS
ncbi:helix-turn-helix domain-containing protein [Limimonas halophila]|uniref:helix-turn-helix domain-containing protein n=1 Tax=Limimonas halophila TaxID=1082479 RepID=UPI000B7D99A4|nr:helix-turn-helix transcriptional regulator [Limimonas halophila]